MKIFRAILSIIICFFVFSLKAQLNYIPQDSIFFEYSTLPVSIDPSPSCIWQIGVPGITPSA